MPLSQIRRGLPQPGGMASERQTFDFATCTCLLAAQNFYFFDYLKNHANSIELQYFLPIFTIGANRREFYLQTNYTT